jgi:mannose-6-phosphate isomerase-like protein (cupin superfamily)
MSVKIFGGIESAHYADDISSIQGIVRFSFLEKEYIKGKSFHIASHIIDDSYLHKKEWIYSQPHKHDFDEINMFISEKSTLKYKLELNGKEQEISSPSLIFIPAGTIHRAEPISGTGIFLCIYLDADIKDNGVNVLL